MILLPDELHEQLRQEAQRAKVSMSKLIRTKLLCSLDPIPSRRLEDPILNVAGICRGSVLSGEIDYNLYGPLIYFVAMFTTMCRHDDRESDRIKGTLRTIP
jgi:hypothetical protein